VGNLTLNQIPRTRGMTGRHAWNDRRAGSDRYEHMECLRIFCHCLQSGQSHAHEIPSSFGRQADSMTLLALASCNDKKTRAMTESLVFAFDINAFALGGSHPGTGVDIWFLREMSGYIKTHKGWKI
jgi:hypothetical protein